MSYLDVLIIRENKEFTTTVYHNQLLVDFY